MMTDMGEIKSTRKFLTYCRNNIKYMSTIFISCQVPYLYFMNIYNLRNLSLKQLCVGLGVSVSAAGPNN